MASLVTAYAAPPRGGLSQPHQEHMQDMIIIRCDVYVFVVYVKARLH